MVDKLSVVINELDLEAAQGVLPDLREILVGAYFDSHMFRDLAEDLETAPDPFRLFLASAQDQPIGVSVVEKKEHEDYEYFDNPPVHIKRFTVASIARGLGVGKSLLDASKRYAFDELQLSLLFGESNEYGALALYGREGAYYRKESVERYNRRNNPFEALQYFAIDISDPRLRGRRYANGGGIHFAFPADEPTQRLVERHGFISQEDILKTLDPTDS